MRVESLMTSRVWSCRPTDRLSDAVEMMWRHDCGCLPVVDELSRVVGMITDRDVCMATYFKGKSPGELNVGSAMSKAVHSCRRQDSLATAEAMMREHQVRRLPVVDGNGLLVAMLTLNDLAREIAREERAGMKRREVTTDELAYVVEALCKSRVQAGLPVPMPIIKEPLRLPTIPYPTSSARVGSGERAATHR